MCWPRDYTCCGRLYSAAAAVAHWPLARRETYPNSRQQARQPPHTEPGHTRDPNKSPHASWATWRGRVPACYWSCALAGQTPPRRVAPKPSMAQPHSTLAGTCGSRETNASGGTAHPGAKSARRLLAWPHSLDEDRSCQLHVERKSKGEEEGERGREWGERQTKCSTECIRM